MLHAMTIEVKILNSIRPIFGQHKAIQYRIELSIDGDASDEDDVQLLAIVFMRSCTTNTSVFNMQMSYVYCLVSSL